MRQPLSILIPSVEDRRNELNRLLNKIDSCIGADKQQVEVLTFRDNKELTIGEKRERMYRIASGAYSWQIDDDDDIWEYAIEFILHQIKQSQCGVDCITFQELCTINGEQFSSNHSLSYGDWEGDGSKLLWDGFHYHRTPFFKSVIKTEIARSVPIPHIRFGEDHQWAQALKSHLKTEIHIPENIYLYQHISSPFNERYGIR